MIWTGQNWSTDTEDLVYQYAKTFAGSLYHTAGINKEAINNAKRANNHAGFNAFLKLAQRDKTVEISSFDTHPHLLNCQNGTLDLRTGGLHAHRREDRITRITACNYDPDAASPMWDRFLEEIQPDPGVRAFLQRSVGYSLLGSVSERSFWILYGTGANGKSIFINTINRLLAAYACGTTSSSIMAVKQTSAIPNDIARLKGKRFIIIPETEENERINAALIKALSAGDTVTARFLFGEYFDFQFVGKLWIATNHKPTITDHSKGFWDRLKLVPFTTRIEADKQMKADELMRILCDEGPAILAWSVQGCRDYLELAGLDVPTCIQREIDLYRHEQDTIAQFIEDRCCTLLEAVANRPDIYHSPAEFEADNSELFQAYRAYCTENGEYAFKQKRFTQNMIERGFLQGRSAKRRYWKGLQILRRE